MAKSILLEYLPEIGSPFGMILYSFIFYMITYFLSWLFRAPEEFKSNDPDVKVRTQAELERLREKGRAMRE
jgi:hypothetical protein